MQLGSKHWLMKSIKKDDDHYVAKGSSVYLNFGGDLLYRFDVSSNRRKKEYDEDIAAAVAEALNQTAKIAIPFMALGKGRK